MRGCESKCLGLGHQSFWLPDWTSAFSVPGDVSLLLIFVCDCLWNFPAFCQVASFSRVVRKVSQLRFLATSNLQNWDPAVVRSTGTCFAIILSWNRYESTNLFKSNPQKGCIFTCSFGSIECPISTWYTAIQWKNWHTEEHFENDKFSNQIQSRKRNFGCIG